MIMGAAIEQITCFVRHGKIGNVGDPNNNRSSSALPNEVHPLGWTGRGPENRLTDPGFRGESPWLSIACIRSNSTHTSSSNSWLESRPTGSPSATASAESDQDLGRQVRGGRARQRHRRRGCAGGLIAALERLVGKLALENEFLKGASRHGHQPRSASTSIVAGPVVSQSQKDAG